MKINICIATFVIFSFSGAAVAEDYWGMSVDALSAESTEDLFGSSSSQDVPGISAVFGRKFDASNFYWGVEGAATAYFGDAFEFSGLTCTDGANGPYMCDLDGAVRLYGVIGKEFSQYSAYAKLGYGAAFGNFATEATTQGSGIIRGATAAIGLSRDLTEKVKMFGEITYDNFTDASDQPAGYTSVLETTGLRMGFTNSF